MIVSSFGKTLAAAAAPLLPDVSGSTLGVNHRRQFTDPREPRRRTSGCAQAQADTCALLSQRASSPMHPAGSAHARARSTTYLPTLVFVQTLLLDIRRRSRHTRVAHSAQRLLNLLFLSKRAASFGTLEFEFLT